VDVVDDEGTAFLCVIGTRRVWVPLAEVGDHGRLVISRGFAQSVGLR